MKQCQAECKTIFSNLKKQEKQLKRKRRWLMGLPLSDLEKNKIFQYRLLPESMLREDDIFYETVKIYIEEAFGAHNDKREDNILQESKEMFDGSNLKRLLLSCLNALTNKGLFLLAMILTRGSINFEKTRPKMKKVIKQSIPRVVGDQNNTAQVEILQHLPELLKDPQNVRENCLTLLISKFRYHHLSAVKILDRLHDVSTDTLHAMLRKLRGVPARVPILQQQKNGETKRKLILEIRRISEKMLSELGRGDELQAPLAKALAVAGLSLKRTLGFSSFHFEDFNQFSPEIKKLQDEISKAICLLKKVKTREVRTFKLLLDPDNNVPGNQRKAAVKMLTEYLFECNDLDTIPKSLLNALAFINRDRQRMRRVCKKKEIEEEVECILNVSAEMKQIVLDFLPDHEFSEDFTDVYMEELEESDDSSDDDFDDYHDQCGNFSGFGDHDARGQILHPRNNLGCRSYSSGLENLEESCGEHVPLDSIPSVSTPKGSCCSSQIKSERDVNGTLDVESMSESVTARINENGFSHHIPNHGRSSSMKGNDPVQGTMVDAGNSLEDGFRGVKFMSSERSSCANLYLCTQDVCDDVSMFAYNIIGHMLEKFAQEDGLDLDQNDNSYLRGGSSSQENEGEKQNSCKNNGPGSIVFQVVEELVPSFPKSGMEKLKALLDIV